MFSTKDDGVWLNQLSLSGGEGYSTIISFVVLMLSSRWEFSHHSMKSRIAELWCWGWLEDKRQEDCIISKCVNMTVLMGRSSVVCVQNKEERRHSPEESLWMGRWCQTSIYSLTHWSVCVEVQDPPTEEVVDIEARDKLLSEDVWLHGVESQWEVCKQEPGWGVGPLQMLMDGIQDEDLCIINPLPVSKLKWVHHWVGLLCDVAIHDPLHWLHGQGCESHGTDIIQDLRFAFFFFWRGLLSSVFNK